MAAPGNFSLNSVLNQDAIRKVTADDQAGSAIDSRSPDGLCWRVFTVQYDFRGYGVWKALHCGCYHNRGVARAAINRVVEQESLSRFATTFTQKVRLLALGVQGLLPFFGHFRI